MRQLGALGCPVGPGNRDARICFGNAAADSSDAKHANVGVVIKARNLQLQIAVWPHIGRRHVLYDRLEQWQRVATSHFRAESGVALKC